jgi:putative ABC transport system permease protein
MNLNPNDLKLITALLVIAALGAPTIKERWQKKEVVENA